MTAETNRQYAYFSIFGDFEPDEITRLTGLPASESWRKGDLHPRRGYERKQSHWSLKSRLSETDEMEHHILDVIAQMQSNSAAFEQISTQFGGCMQLVGYFHDSYPGLYFERATVEALANFKLSVDFDFYALWSDARDAT